MHIASLTFLILAIFTSNITSKKIKITTGLVCEEKRLIVDTHNRMRQQIASGRLPGQPKASNMQKIVWDDQLADLAQSYADKMKFKHNKNRSDDRFMVGENLYVSWSTGSNGASNWTEPINDWFEEHEYYSYKPLVPNPATGHYTQIVWADTLYVGCGYTAFKNQIMIHKLYVCNYGPALVRMIASLLALETIVLELRINLNVTFFTENGVSLKLCARYCAVLNCKKKYRAQIVSSGLSCEDRRVIVNVHNQLREQVASGKLKTQPKASDMQLIVWDDKLESMAQKWANNMQIGHSKNRTDVRFSTGENLMVIGPYLNFDIVPKWEEIINDWFNEHKLYKYQPYVKDKAVGHYTQMIWATTKYIGCGFATFTWNQGPIAYYVCHYGPSGNYLGRYPYESGPGCDYLCCDVQCSTLLMIIHMSFLTRASTFTYCLPKMARMIVLFCCCLVILFNSEARDISGSVSNDDKQIILDRHNELRKIVAEGELSGQPKASNMNRLVWDDKLQALAQHWAHQGKREHNQQRHDDRFKVGENIYYMFDSRAEIKANWTVAIDDWYAENKLYTFSTGFSASTGHYTQLVWAKTKYVGCGYSHYREHGLTHGTYVCNYGPAGNWIGEYPYETGPGCEELC
ncbi:uncharacterized protein LOC143915889 [Arctopsyche grandis]|uniref:uncharacterized protein LOC143915889 n=1 Tax=Arctopsyche grandis TaxID=121162 RepID=UPI00406D8C66